MEWVQANRFHQYTDVGLACGRADSCRENGLRPASIETSPARGPKNGYAFLSAVFHETKQQLGVKRNVQFVASERIPGPAVVGYSKPAIVISPSLLITLKQEQLQYILAHEFAHIQRRDVAVNWLVHIILIIHWFNPLLWLAVHKARQDQEMACDACVLIG